MSPASRRRISRSLVSFAAYIAAGVVFMLFIRGRQIDRGDIATLLVVSALVTGLMSVMTSLISPKSRALPLLASVLVNAAFYVIILLVGVVGGVWAANVIVDGLPRANARMLELIHIHELAMGLKFAAGMLVVFAFVNGISLKLGPGVLLKWLLGRYHQPRLEERVFMFLDLRGSTGLAEQLGDLRFSALIRDVFNDLTTPLLNHGAEVSHYIGDEVVVTWPLGRGVQHGECLRCYFAVSDELCRLRGQYLDEYGIEPTFKAGMHCGSVVATQVGQIKSEIVYHGDVLNTTARIQSLCHSENADLLISDELAKAVPQMDGLTFEALGPRELRGKGQPVQLVRVSRAATSRESTVR